MQPKRNFDAKSSHQTDLTLYYLFNKRKQKVAEERMERLKAPTAVKPEINGLGLLTHLVPCGSLNYLVYAPAWLTQRAQ